jgi:outer membrane protein assembly factor BamB
MRARLLLAAVLLVSLAGPAAPQPIDGTPKYPKVNVAVAYKVDASWPQRPEGHDWGAVPGIAVDAKDQVYVFTRAAKAVQVYDANGKFLRAFSDSALTNAHHLKIDPEGNIWTTDVADHTVRKWSPEGKPLLTLGEPKKAGRDQKHFYMPTDMAIAADGDIYVSDGYGNARIVHFDKTGKYKNEWGTLGSKPGQFSVPHAITVDSKKNVYVADRNNARIQKFDPNGKLVDVWENIITPWGFCMLPNDEIWVCGSSPMQWRPEDGALGCPPKDQVFMRFNTQGKLLQLWTVPKGIDGFERPGEVNWVHCIAADSKGNLYVGDILGKRAQKFLRVAPQATASSP